MTEDDIQKTYVGDKKVKGLVLTELTTPSGSQIHKILYDDGNEELMTDARWQAIRSYKQTDASKARDRLIKNAGKKMYALLMEFGPYLYEVDHILNETVRLANDATEKANNVLWGKEFSEQRSLLDVNNILLKHYGAHQSKETEAGDEGDAPSPERGSADTADKA
jgi:hypothetical protein